mmetsp:Transcript_34366/g.78723  ORF Transcript_34366/g.78723 Transcript_34366/m.78723 type:complete len:342 (+) Transcript_34366:731-1756(+)
MGLAAHGLRQAVAEATYARERLSTLNAMTFCALVGIGAGFVMSSAAIPIFRSVAARRIGSAAASEVPAGVYVGLMAAVLSVWFVCVSFALSPPPPAGSIDYGAPSRVRSEGHVRLIRADGMSTVSRSTLVRTAVAIQVLRGLVMAGIEAGTALILDLEFGWSVVTIGVALGMSFFIGCALYFILREAADAENELMMSRLCAVVAVVAAIFLFYSPFARMNRLLVALMILLASATIVACLYTSCGVVEGLSARCCCNEDEQRQAVFWQIMCGLGLGRVIGYVLCLALLTGQRSMQQGRDAYAAAQFVFLVFSVLLHEVLVVQPLQGGASAEKTATGSAVAAV